MAPGSSRKILGGPRIAPGVPGGWPEPKLLVSLRNHAPGVWYPRPAEHEFHAPEHPFYAPAYPGVSALWKMMPG